VVRAEAPGRAELGSRGREDEERRLRAALGESLHEIKRGGVRPVQVLERERDGLRARPGEKPGYERRQLPAAQFLRRKLCCAVLRQRDVDQRRDQRRIFGGVEADQGKRILKVGEAPVGRLIRAEPLAAPFGDRVQRRILQELRRRQFDKGVGRLAKRRAKLLDKPRLADAGFADNERELDRAIARPPPAPAQEFELLPAPDEGDERARAGAPPAACAHDAVERHRPRHSPERLGTPVFGDEQPGGLTLHGRGHEHRSRLGQALNARGDIGRFPEHFARRVNHHRTRIKADAGDELRRLAGVPRVQVSKRALDEKRSARRAFGVVLLRLRIAEQRHQPVAQPLEDMAAKVDHYLRRLVEISVDQVAPVFGVELRGERRRSDKVAKHHRDRTALGVGPRSRPRPGGHGWRGQTGRWVRGSRRVRRLGRHAERGDRVKQSSPVADDRDAEILQIFGRQGREEVALDRVVAERRFVMPETEVVEPGRDVHGRLHSARCNHRFCPVDCKASTNSGRRSTTSSAEVRILALTTRS
jgi:hypothetical protein